MVVTDRIAEADHRIAAVIAEAVANVKSSCPFDDRHSCGEHGVGARVSAGAADGCCASFDTRAAVMVTIETREVARPLPLRDPR